MNPRIIGKNIKLARQATDMSQKQLAQKLGVSWEMISRYENGRSNALNRLSEIAMILSKNLDFFLTSHELDAKPSNDNVPFLFELKDSMEESLHRYDVTYSLPEWVIKNYSKVFVLKLKNISSLVIDYGERDLGIFSADLSLDFKYYLNQSKQIVIENNSAFAGLVYIEKRYV
jgi:transcriptional regulator with XRE-family HTH domain